MQNYPFLKFNSYNVCKGLIKERVDPTVLKVYCTEKVMTRKKAVVTGLLNA